MQFYPRGRTYTVGIYVYVCNIYHWLACKTKWKKSLVRVINTARVCLQSVSCIIVLDCTCYNQVPVARSYKSIITDRKPFSCYIRKALINHSFTFCHWTSSKYPLNVIAWTIICPQITLNCFLKKPKNTDTVCFDTHFLEKVIQNQHWVVFSSCYKVACVDY